MPWLFVIEDALIYKLVVISLDGVTNDGGESAGLLSVFAMFDDLFDESHNLFRDPNTVLFWQNRNVLGHEDRSDGRVSGIEIAAHSTRILLGKFKEQFRGGDCLLQGFMAGECPNQVGVALIVLLPLEAIATGDRGTEDAHFPALLVGEGPGKRGALLNHGLMSHLGLLRWEEGAELLVSFLPPLLRV